MSPFPAAQLKLIGGEPVRSAGRLDFRSAQVRVETVQAAGLAATDARWVLAVRAASVLEGGRAAILRPEHRRRLLAVAERMGLRPFDASMVIAVVQDAARSGERVLGVGTEARLGLVRPAVRRGGGVGWLMAAAVGLGVVMFVVMARWVGG